LAGTSVDLLFFPIDTVKTRLQSAQGFAKAGGCTGIYKGVGSVIVGSAPGGAFRFSPSLYPREFTDTSLAAIFFVTYDTLKQTLPIPPHLAPVNHMLSASIGEVVRLLHWGGDWRSTTVHLPGRMFDPRSDGSNQNSHPNFDIWSIGHLFLGFRKTSP
jgi:hypothetical protein